jgi:hypothetical protein
MLPMQTIRIEYLGFFMPWGVDYPARVNPASELLRTSDKFFWHGYIDFYERIFAGLEVKRIGEIGVFRGHSIQWLLERFPHAHVWGADIVARRPEWPVNARFTSAQLDQGDSSSLSRFLSNGFDLLIDDGSHRPEHQALALVLGMRALNPGGLLIIEDIQTSHRNYGRKWWRRSAPRGNALSVLLGIQHYLHLGLEVDADRAALIADGSLLEPGEVLELAGSIASLELYRRTTLPRSCFNCGSQDFNFSAMRCRCGVDVFSDTDSMSFAVRKKPAA